MSTITLFTLAAAVLFVMVFIVPLLFKLVIAGIIVGAIYLFVTGQGPIIHAYAARLIAWVSGFFKG